MAFRIPTFNLAVNLWRNTSTVVNPPDVTFMANLTRGERIANYVDVVVGPDDYVALMSLLMPALTDIRPAVNAGPEDLVEVPAGSGRFYIVVAVDDVAKGFANEYRFAYLMQVSVYTLASIHNPWAASPWPVPIP